MPVESVGELVPVGGGDPIPLRRGVMTIGRRESCDICLKFPNISGLHCELAYKDAGFWQVRDLGSTNGIKVNGERVLNRPLRPGDEIGHRQAQVYDPVQPDRRRRGRPRGCPERGRGRLQPVADGEGRAGQAARPDETTTTTIDRRPDHPRPGRPTAAGPFHSERLMRMPHVPGPD